MEKVSWNTVNKNKMDFKQIVNEKHKSLPSQSSSLTSLGSLLPKAVNENSYAYNPFTAPWGARENKIFNKNEQLIW